MTSASWLALAIGNSRCHWGWFRQGHLVETWDLPHRSSPDANPESSDRSYGFPAALDAAIENPQHLPLWIASVVPQQTLFWQTHPQARCLTLADVPLQNLYPSLGIDRALALWGLAQTRGLPALAIDAGTALTFSAADPQGCFRGGAILPGLRLQARSLNAGTAELPPIPFQPAASLPPRWSMTTATAIHSGILYSLLASLESFVGDWQQQFPQSAIGMTGGDADRLWHTLQQLNPGLAAQIQLDPALLFRGMQAIVEAS